MSRSTCDPCCNPPEFARSNESFKAASLTLLCNLLAAFAGNTEQQISLEILCDPNTGETVALQVYYDADGNVTSTQAFLLDGTPYGGVIADLVSCFGNAISPDAGNIVVQHADGLYVPAYINAGLFGDGSDGNVTVSVNTTLTRDMFYDNLTIDTSSKLSPDGYKIFVKGTLTIGAGSSIDRAGADGGNAAGATGGAAGSFSSLVQRSLYASGPGVAGRTATTAAGAAGSFPNSFFVFAGGLLSAAGGNGGNGVASGGAGSGGAVFTGKQGPVNYLTPNPVYGVEMVSGGLGGAGAAAGGGNTVAGTGGGGGGSAAGGGVLVVFARHIVLAGTIKANGGNGGNGGNGTVGGGATGGGGGGGAGSGGVIYCCYEDLTGAGTFSVAGGAGGAAGSGANGGTNGTAGTTGGVGNIFRFNMTTQAFE